MSSPWPPETSTPALPIARPATTADGEGLQAVPNPPLPEGGASSRVEANCDCDRDEQREHQDQQRCGHRHVEQAARDRRGSRDSRGETVAI